MKIAVFSGGFLFGMERFFERRLDRRTTIKIAVLTALGLSAAFIFGRERDEQPKGFLSEAEIKKDGEAKKNFAKTLSWMSNLENPQVRQAFEFFKGFQPELDNIESQKIGFTATIQKDPAKVTTIQTADGIKLRIILSLQKFANDGFTMEDAAASLFSAFVVYQMAKDDPRKFELDSQFRVSVTEQAAREAVLVFTSK